MGVLLLVLLAGGGCPGNGLLASAEFVVPNDDDHDISVTRSSAAHAHAQLSKCQYWNPDTVVMFSRTLITQLTCILCSATSATPRSLALSLACPLSCSPSLSLALSLARPLSRSPSLPLSGALLASASDGFALSPLSNPLLSTYRFCCCWRRSSRVEGTALQAQVAWQGG